VENVQAQDFLVQELKRQLLPVMGVRPQGDKRERLSLASKFVFNGNVLFPRQGAEELIRQLIGFGLERHDDLADAFSMLVLKTVELRPNRINRASVEAKMSRAFCNGGPNRSIGGNPWKKVY
jgi:phage terminase large subunit-like protein